MLWRWVGNLGGPAGSQVRGYLLSLLGISSSETAWLLASHSRVADLLVPCVSRQNQDLAGVGFAGLSSVAYVGALRRN